MSDRTENAAKILDYWYITEFLVQASYEDCTYEDQTIRNLKKYKESGEAYTEKRKPVWAFETLKADQNICAVIKDQAHLCNMSAWGNLTFFIGKIKRQTCIEKLVKALGVQIDQAEVNTDYIPILSFQCTNEGNYIEYSLSLSPVLWALYQAEEHKGIEISKWLSEGEYSRAVKDLEDKYFKDESEEDHQERELEFISINKVNEIYRDLLWRYGKYVADGDIEEKFGLKYRLYIDSEQREKYDEDYSGLCQDYFSQDLKMVKSYIENEKYEVDPGMLSDLISYICAPNEENADRVRHDLVKPADRNQNYEEISGILNCRNAPLGKWPSEFMPSFMQETAINLVVSNQNCDRYGRIFSVNGPPGTGKTTLLKEIIVNNVVEKASVLSKYENPNSAFEAVHFKKSTLKGKDAKYHSYWYKFKDDSITDFGILVASSNNNAVENITKELPLRKEVSNDLFNVENTDIVIDVHEKDNDVEYLKDIYFTKYANEYFAKSKNKGLGEAEGKVEDNQETWGMITAPLGKAKNIGNYYYGFLYPIYNEMLWNINFVKDRGLDRYSDARKAFVDQLDKVQRIQEQLGEYGDLVLSAYRAWEESKRKEKENTIRISEIKQEIADLDHLLEEDKNRLRIYTAELESKVDSDKDILQRTDVLIESKNAYVEEKNKYEKKAKDILNSISIFAILLNWITLFFFNISILDDKYEENDRYQNEARKCEARSMEIKGSIEALQLKHKNSLDVIDNLKKQLKEAQDTLNDHIAEREKCFDRIRTLENEIKTYKEKAAAMNMQKDTALTKYGDSGIIMDKAFVEKTLSSDNEISTEAQASNPWMTEEFNREREKLFFLALQLCKEFVLHTKGCQSNLYLLGHYWGFRKQEKNCKFTFDQQEKEEMIGSLLNTLFLITPVLSTTFASVGRFLKDVKKPGMIGTLIVDEAGQAQPQMAVGALFRSRRAIIVGDPKQVEPVVTDDLKMLKEAFSEEIYKNYKDKGLSVQRCADILNPFGTYINNDAGYPEWVGCPLLVHRRCISPMYEISNTISYNGIMKTKTNLPKAERCDSFLFDSSQWFEKKGAENGNGDHYVREQGILICEMVEQAFERGTNSELFIISPFNSVVNGLREAISRFANDYKGSALSRSAGLYNWLNNNIGTVHKFQGKEANEVIFVLGCDKSLQHRYAVTGFVNSNIVNVAVTRAKYRLYIVGDSTVWKNNAYVYKAKEIINGKLT